MLTPIFFQISPNKLFILILLGCATISLTFATAATTSANSGKKSSSSAAKFLAKQAQLKAPNSAKGGWETPRQYSSYAYGSNGGGYDIYTLLAVSAFAALFGGLFFSLATGGSLRSLDSSSSSSTIKLPFGFSIDSETVAQLMSKVGDAISSIDGSFINEVIKEAEKSSGGRSSRVLRDISGQMGVNKWITAYKKDPIEYQCVRKVACETLAESSMVANSMKSPFGGIILSTVGLFIENGNELQSIVQDTIGNPEKCREMAPWGFCSDDDN